MQWRADHGLAFVNPRLGGDFLTQQQDQDDEGNRNADQPEENGHVVFLSSFEGIIG
jgi:hypothetical protein